MKIAIAGLGAAIAALMAANPASASVTTCMIAGEPIMANNVVLLRNQEPAYVYGEEPSARINLRDSVGIESDRIGYGLAGDFIWVKRQALDLNCETWVYVEFPLTGAHGWMHSRYVRLAFGRGWWT